MKKVDIYTDGACSGNPGKGGWAAVLSYKGHEKEISGYEDDTTNNRMELTAAIKALETLKEPCRADIFTDSTYLVKAFEEHWLENWKKNGWKTAAKNSVKNSDLWKELDRLSGIHKVRWVKVKGHSDNDKNNRCDSLARLEIKEHGLEEDIAKEG